MTAARGIFDTHCHLFERGYHGRFGFIMSARGEELEAYERFSSEYGVTRSLVVGYEEVDEYRGNNDYISALAEQRSWLTPLRWVAPGSPLGAARAISLYVADAASAHDAAEALEQSRAVGRAPAIVSLNAAPEAIGALAATLRLLDSTWFLVSHLGLPGPVTSPAEARARLQPLLRLAGTPNVSVKLSGQYAASAGPYPHSDVQAIVDLVGDAFGPGGLVWGSDFSPCLEYITLDEAINCALPAGASDHERHAIMYGTAAGMFDHYYGATA